MMYAKAFVPLFVSVILTGLDALGVDRAMSTEQALTLLVTAIIVYLVPNKN